MSRDSRLVREPLTKSSGFALKNAKQRRTVTPTAEIPQQAFCSGKSAGRSHLRKDREVAEQCAQRASFWCSRNGTDVLRRRVLLFLHRGPWTWSGTAPNKGGQRRSGSAETQRSLSELHLSYPVIDSAQAASGNTVSTVTWNGPEKASSGRTSSCVNGDASVRIHALFHDAFNK